MKLLRIPIFLLALSSASALYAQGVKRDIVYDAITIEQFRAMVSDMGLEPEYLDWGKKEKGRPGKAIRVKINLTVLLFPEACKELVCSRFTMAIFINGVPNAPVGKLNAKYSGARYVLSDDVLRAEHDLYLSGGVTAKHLKQRVRKFHDVVSSVLRKENVSSWK